MTDFDLTPEEETPSDKLAWSAPELHEYDLKETKGGFINASFEGPYDFLLGDCPDSSGFFC